MKNLKYVAKIEDVDMDRLVDEINDFIKSILLENEYIIDVRVIKTREIEYPPNVLDVKDRICELVALIYVGEDKNE